MTDDFDQRCYDPKTTFFGPDYPKPEVKKSMKFESIPENILLGTGKV